MPELAEEDGAWNGVDLVDDLLPGQHVLVRVDLGGLSHRSTLGLDESAAGADEAGPAESALVEILAVQLIGISVVRSGVRERERELDISFTLNEVLCLPVSRNRGHAKSVSKLNVADLQRLRQVLDGGDELFHVDDVRLLDSRAILNTEKGLLSLQEVFSSPL